MSERLPLNTKISLRERAVATDRKIANGDEPPLTTMELYPSVVISLVDEIEDLERERKVTASVPIKRINECFEFLINSMSTESSVIPSIRVVTVSALKDVLKQLQSEAQ